jgi:hypothetical protein
MSNLVPFTKFLEPSTPLNPLPIRGEQIPRCERLEFTEEYSHELLKVQPLFLSQVHQGRRSLDCLASARLEQIAESLF